MLLASLRLGRCVRRLLTVTPADTLNMPFLSAKVAHTVFEAAALGGVLSSAMVAGCLQMGLVTVINLGMGGRRGVTFVPMHRCWRTENFRILLRQFVREGLFTCLIKCEFRNRQQAAL